MFCKICSAHWSEKSCGNTCYTHLAFLHQATKYNHIATFSFAILKYPDGLHDIVWLPEATIRYLRGTHIALFIIAVLILLAGVATLFFYSLGSGFSTTNTRSSLSGLDMYHGFSLFLEPYHVPYTFKHRYTGLV